MTPDPEVVEALRRWEDAGGLWRVLSRSGGQVVVGLYRCDGGEEVDRISSSDDTLARYLDGRIRSEDGPP